MEKKTLWEEFRFEIRAAFGKGRLVFVSGNPQRPFKNLVISFYNRDSFRAELQTYIGRITVALGLPYYISSKFEFGVSADFFSTATCPNLKISSKNLPHSQSN